MSDESNFRCPVCRASQSLRETCRRCQADLRLVVTARRRLAYVVQAHAEASSKGDGERLQLLEKELRWLAPSQRRS